jgi:hypothetical protein
MTDANELNLSDLRDPDGYYRDGLEVLRRAIAWIVADDARDECEIPLPKGQVVTVELNGGVPHYSAAHLEPEDIHPIELTASATVDFLEGAHEVGDEIPIDPALPSDFDNTPNDSRPLSHQAWWNRPFIVTERWELETWEQYRARLAEYGSEPSYTPEEWAEFQEQQRAAWLERFPGGTSYGVRCLDGGAWDRSTWWGEFNTLEEAVACAKKGPIWRGA